MRHTTHALASMFVLAYVALHTLCASAAAAQSAADISVSAKASTTDAFVGDAVRVTVSLSGVGSTNGLTPPAARDIPGARVEYQGAGQRSSSIMGFDGRRRVSASVDFNFAVVPGRAGVLTVPPFEVEFGGAVWQTDPIDIVVREPQTSDIAPVEVTVSNTTPFVGEPVTLTFTWTFPESRVSNGEFIAYQLPDGVRPLAGIDPSPRLTQQRNRSVREITFMGQPTYMLQERFARGRDTFSSLRIQLYIEATEAGEQLIPPVEIAFDEIVSSGRSRLRGAITERRIARSTPITLEARPLPTQSVPHGFDGLVGRVDLSAGVDQTNIGVGDPIALRLMIRGDEPLARVSPPELDVDPAFTDDFRVDDEGWSLLNEQPGLRIFQTVIRAMRDDVEAAPPIRLPYFDAERERYIIAETEPLPLNVRDRRRVTAADAIRPSESAVPPPVNATELERSLGGIPGVPITEAMLGDRAFVMADAMRTPAAIGMLVGGPACLAFAGLIAVGRSKRDPSVRRRTIGLKRAYSLNSSELAQQANAARALLAAHLDIGESGVTAHDAAAVLDADSDAERTLLDALRHDEACRFGDGVQSSPPDARGFRSALAKTHRRLIRLSTAGDAS